MTVGRVKSKTGVCAACNDRYYLKNTCAQRIPAEEQGGNAVLAGRPRARGTLALNCSTPRNIRGDWIGVSRAGE